MLFRSYKKTIIEPEPVDEAALNHEVLQILIDEKNSEIQRLYQQLQSKDEQLARKDEQLRVKDVQIAEKDKQIDQQQQLTLQAMTDRETLQLELDQAMQEVQEVKEEQKRGFFSRMFGGNKQS